MSRTTIYDPIANALGVSKLKNFHENYKLPEDAVLSHSLGGFMIHEDHIEEWKALISATMKKKIAESDYWKKGVTAAADKIRGTKQSKKHKAKKAKKLLKPITIEGVLYNSGKDAAKALGVKPATISNWVKKAGSRNIINIPSGSNQYVKR